MACVGPAIHRLPFPPPRRVLQRWLVWCIWRGVGWRGCCTGRTCSGSSASGWAPDPPIYAFVFLSRCALYCLSVGAFPGAWAGAPEPGEPVRGQAAQGGPPGRLALCPLAPLPPAPACLNLPVSPLHNLPCLFLCLRCPLVVSCPVPVQGRALAGLLDWGDLLKVERPSGFVL
jgi:hypothetical protein